MPLPAPVTIMVSIFALFRRVDPIKVDFTLQLGDESINAPIHRQRILSQLLRIRRIPEVALTKRGVIRAQFLDQHRAALSIASMQNHLGPLRHKTPCHVLADPGRTAGHQNYPIIQTHDTCEFCLLYTSPSPRDS